MILLYPFLCSLQDQGIIKFSSLVWGPVAFCGCVYAFLHCGVSVSDDYHMLPVGFSVLGFYIFGVPYKRGFFCDDESIRLPFKDSTVTSAMLYFVGLVLPICVVSSFKVTLNPNNLDSTVLG